MEANNILMIEIQYFQLVYLTISFKFDKFVLREEVFCKKQLSMPFTGNFSIVSYK